MTIALSAPRDTDPLPVTLSPAMYFNITRPRGNYVPYSIHKSAFKTRNNVAEGGAGPFALRDTFKLPSGIGATCVLKSPFRDEFDRDLVHRGDSSTRNKVIRLVAEYFEPECRSVFTSGINLRVYMPPADVEKSKANTDDTDNNTLTNAKYYPYCKCKKGHVGFKCGADGFVDPPQEIVVTGDILQDITGTSDNDFYLNTNDRFRLHRYGGFMFGKQLSYVPTSFGKEKQFRYFAKNLIVKDTSQVWFNEKGYHSMPIYVNTLSNAILRANLPPSKGNPAAYGITLVNHPMKKTNNFLDEDYIKGGMDVLMAIFIIVAMAFVPASFVVFPVYERSIKAKHLQFVSGLNKGVYWVTNYLWDLCNYMIPAICIIVILLAFHLPAYVANGNFEAVLALFLLYGWSVTPMMYPATFLFSEPSVAFIVMILANLFTGITCVVSSFMLELFSDDESISRINAILKKVFLVFPNYCLGNGLMDIAMNEYKNEFYSHIGQYDMIHSPMEWDLTGKKLVAMAITGALSFVITLLCEYGFFIRRQGTVVDSPEDFLDSDVLAEQERATSGPGRTDLLRLQNLTKVYKRWRKTDIVAVNKLTFAVPTGECFGLLGINGAGKTTTFKMLTGDIQPTSGDASIGGHSISRDLDSVQRQIGYCPQFDALFDQLTPREHLQLYARLRGIPAADEPSVVEHAISSLDLVKYADQPAGTLSGGNKRKLSTAISLIGDPPLIYMDEPTSGMDPYSRRFLWGVIQNLVNEGKSVLFTSHSMAECETLCSRLSIMVNGQLKCLGSIQHLKDKYGNGYTLTLSLKSNTQVQDVADYVVSRVPECMLKDIGYRIVVLDVNVRYSGLADIYKEMETVKLVFDVADYTLSQNTLDNVFINFAKEQSDVVQYLEEEAKAPVEYDLDLAAGRRTRMKNENEAEQRRELADDDEPLIEMNPRDTRLEIHSDDDLLMPY